MNMADSDTKEKVLKHHRFIVFDGEIQSVINHYSEKGVDANGIVIKKLADDGDHKDLYEMFENYGDIV